MEKRYNVNVVVRGQVKSENSSLPVAVRVSKTRVLKLPNRELKHIRFLATDVNRKFMFLLLASFHARPLSYKALILGFTTCYFQRKGSNTRRKEETLTSG